MSKVNHKLVKKRLNEQRSKITDRQFFSSRLLAGHFEDMAAAQTRRYHYNRRVHVSLYWKPRDEHAASTDNLFIRINTGHPLVTKVRGRENRYQVICGMFAHELGHVLHTDFLAEQTRMNYFASNIWYPHPPELKTAADARREKAFWDYVKSGPQNLSMAQMVAHHISNVIEDGYIENRMLMDFPGTLGYGLEKFRERHYEMISTVTQLREEEDDEKQHIFESILQILLSYAKFGEIKYGDEPLSDERIQAVFSLISDVDGALLNSSGKERLGAANMILVRCWDYIEGFCEACRRRQEAAAAAGGTEDIGEIMSKLLRSVPGSTGIGEGNHSPVAETAGHVVLSATAAARARTLAAVSESAEKNEPEPEAKDDEAGTESAENSQDGTESENGTENAKDDAENENLLAEPENEEEASETGGQSLEEGSALPSGQDMPLAGGSMSGTGKTEVSESEQGRIPYHQTEAASNPTSGKIEKNDAYEREQCARAAADIERVLDKMAEKAACEQLENERLRELNEAARNISYGNIHAGVNIRVNRMLSVDEELKEQYDAIAAPLLAISRQLQKSLARELKESRRGGKQTGLLMGRRLDSHALHRNDGKVFYRNRLPNEIPELAVALLLDESGSMSSSDRCTYARAAAVIIYDFCQSLGIPIMVYGHSTGYPDTVEMYSYAEFDSFDQDDRYRLMDIGSRRNNRDGAALRFVAEQLSGRSEEEKLLLLVSDGQPADHGYDGSAAEEDLRGIKQEYQRKKILFVAAAIGEDKQNIERIYGDSFMDITDLSQMPIKLTAVVKRHIRV